MIKAEEIILCIFSFNRCAYLKNLIASIDLFYPKIKVIIYDDNSDQPQLLQYYLKLKERDNYRIVLTKFKAGKNKHGGLYYMMNLAFQQAREERYKYAFFIQDDMQFVRYLDLSAYCEETFRQWKNAIMISPVFLQKIYLPKIYNYIEKIKGDFVFKNYGIADVGIIHLEKAEHSHLEFSNEGERYNGTKYYNSGHQLILSKNPCLVWVPWVLSYKNKKRKGFPILTKDHLFVNPVNNEIEKRLAGNKKIPFLEDYTSLYFNWLPKPYIYGGVGLKDIIISYFNYWKYLLSKRKEYERTELL